MLSPNAQEFIPQTTNVVGSQYHQQHHHNHQMQQHQQHLHPIPILQTPPSALTATVGQPTWYIISGNASPIVPGTATAAYTPTAMFNHLNNYFYQNASYNDTAHHHHQSSTTTTSTDTTSGEINKQHNVSSYQQTPLAIYNAHLTQATAASAVAAAAAAAPTTTPTPITAYPTYTAYQLSPIVPATPYIPPHPTLINYSLMQAPPPQNYGQQQQQNVPPPPQHHQNQMYQPVFNKNLNNAANRKSYSNSNKFNKTGLHHNLPPSTSRFNNNNNKRGGGGVKQSLDEKDWPSLSTADGRQLVVDEQQVAPPAVVVDEATRKMSSLKNVNLIKYTIQQHYMNENNHQHHRSERSFGDASSKSTNNNNSRLSFKEAVLTKPVVVVPQPPPQPSSTKTSEQLVVATVVARRKSNRKRRGGGSRKSSTKQKTDEEDEETSSGDEGEEFDLTKQDFPDLGDAAATDSSVFKHSNNKAHTITDKQQVKLSQQTATGGGGGKKSRQPINYEFATMISALEKGEQQKDKANKYNKDKFSLNSMTSRHMQNRVRPLQQHQLNPTAAGVVAVGNLKTTVVKKGKERETPKKKKPSTLKKIILKEREEKKRQKDQIQHIDVINDVSSPSPLVVDGVGGSYSTTIDQISSQMDKVLSVEVNNKSGGDDNDTPTEKDSSVGNQSKDSSSSSTNEQQSTLDDEEGGDDNNTEIMSNQLSPISQNSPISVSGYSVAGGANSPYTLLNSINNDRNLLSLEKLEQRVKQKIHSRKFREYCNQIVNKDIDEVCSALLHEIVRFQDRLYHKNPTKAKSKRRYVMGIREVTKHLKLAKLKCVILAPNCEKIQTKGGLDDAINNIIKACMEQNVPFLFALGRKGLGKAVNKLVPISVVGIFDYSGAEEFFKKLVELANNAKLAYQNMVEAYEKEECEHLITEHTRGSVVYTNSSQPNEELVYNKSVGGGLLVNGSSSSVVAAVVAPATTILNPRIPSHMGHSRNASNGSNISIEPTSYHTMNYHTHSRSASGTFNYGHTTTTSSNSHQFHHHHGGGHSRSASSGGQQPMMPPSTFLIGADSMMMSASNLGLNSSVGHWTHSRTPSNCSNISIISRLSEPMSEVGGVVPAAANTTAAAAAAYQFYTEQVRQEMRECHETTTSSIITSNNNNNNNSGVVVVAVTSSGSSEPEASQNNSSQPAASSVDKDANANAAAAAQPNSSSSLANLHLGCISEIDPVEHE